MMRRMLMMLGVLCAVSGPVSAAEIGVEAPGFELQDAMGNTRSLEEFRGKYVVLEWLNYDCPFVKKHYNSGNMQQLQSAYTAEDVVWLAINSSAPGKQGHMTAEQALTRSAKKGSSATAVLLDPDGQVGRAYEAKTTPHMYVIDPEGVLVYAGAIDDVPSTSQGDIAGATNWVSQALDEVLAGKTITVSATAPYGCSVKY